MPKPTLITQARCNSALLHSTHLARDFPPDFLLPFLKQNQRLLVEVGIIVVYSILNAQDVTSQPGIPPLYLLREQFFLSTEGRNRKCGLHQRKFMCRWSFRTENKSSDTSLLHAGFAINSCPVIILF